MLIDEANKNLMELKQKTKLDSYAKKSTKILQSLYLLKMNLKIVIHTTNINN